MKTNSTQLGIAAAAIALALTVSASVSGQESYGAGEKYRLQDSSQPDVAAIGMAYRQLYETTLSTLQTEALTWKADHAARGVGETAPSTAGTAGTTGISLRSEDLVIAACSKGLLAGAPLDGPRAHTPLPGDLERGDTGARSGGMDEDPLGGMDPQATGSQAKRSGESGETVGMVVVCSHPTASAASVSGGVGDSASTREASSPATGTALGSAATGGQLKPGVYCVKRSGNSAWLADENGQVVLRTTVDAAPAGGAVHGLDGDWESTFEAIAKEAMTTLQWKQDPHSSSRK